MSKVKVMITTKGCDGYYSQYQINVSEKYVNDQTLSTYAKQQGEELVKYSIVDFTLDSKKAIEEYILNNLDFEKVMIPVDMTTFKRGELEHNIQSILSNFNRTQELIGENSTFEYTASIGGFLVYI